MRRWFVGLGGLALCVALSGAGCASFTLSVMQSPNVTSTAVTPTLGASVAAWSPRAAGVERTSLRFATSSESEVILYRLDTSVYRFQFAHSTSAASVAEWLRLFPEARIALNGVYFQENYLPSGWLKTQGKVIGKRRFDADKSGLLILQPTVRLITEPADMKRLETTIVDGAQSFPILIMNGQPNIKEDSGKVGRRTFVGVDTTGRWLYLGVVPYAGISLYELAQFLGRSAIRWQTVLNLDGGPSSGMVFRDTLFPERVDSYVTVPNVLIGTPK